MWTAGHTAQCGGALEFSIEGGSAQEKEDWVNMQLALSMEGLFHLGPSPAHSNPRN